MYAIEMFGDCLTPASQALFGPQNQELSRLANIAALG
jgi:hypothetical protein